MNVLKGECNCGVVSFKIDSILSDVYICHCSICRKSTGGSIWVNSKASWEIIGDSGKQHLERFEA